MNTQIIPPSKIQLAINGLKRGEIVALPTETVYGLAAHAKNKHAVEQIFIAKSRPSNNPLIVHVASPEEAFSLGKNIPEYARELAKQFWPGPLTLIFTSTVEWPWIQAGQKTIAVRVPSHPLFQKVLKETGPLAAPSANLSGEPSPTTAAHCLSDLAGKIPYILDGGACEKGIESTVVDCTQKKPVILRPGPITTEQIIAITRTQSKSDALSPGTRYTHYRPKAKVHLVQDIGEVNNHMCMTISAQNTSAQYSQTYSTFEELSQNLYAWFRKADELHVRHIYVECVEEKGIGVAIMNRLRKATHSVS